MKATGPERHQVGVKSKQMTCGTSQAPRLEELTRGREQLGELMLRARDHQNAIRRQVVEIILEGLARQNIRLRERQRARRDRGRGHRLNRDDRVVLLRRPPHVAAPIFGDELDLGLLKEPPPLLAHASSHQVVDDRIDFDGSDRRGAEVESFKHFAPRSGADDQHLGMLLADVGQTGRAILRCVSQVVAHPPAQVGHSRGGRARVNDERGPRLRPAGFGLCRQIVHIDPRERVPGGEAGLLSGWRRG